MHHSSLAAELRDLARDLRHAEEAFDVRVMTDGAAQNLWDAVQLPPALIARFRDALDHLVLAGIRSQFFSTFPEEKLIIPSAARIADQLVRLADEIQALAARELPARGASDAVR